MKLNRNSLNAKLYCWFYGQSDSQLPNNLCPYFWKLVLAWLLIIPYGIYSLPHIIILEVFDKTYKNGENSTGFRLASSSAIYVICFILLCMGTAVATMFTTLYQGTFFGHIWIGGFMFWVVTIIVLIYFGIKALVENIKNKKRKVYDDYGNRIYPVKKSNVLIEFIKAKYNKYCPKIDWVNNDK